MPGQLSLFGSRRQRGRQPPPPLEKELHKQTADILDRWKTRGWLHTHIGHGGFKLDIIPRMELKRKGLKPGWADFILLAPHPAKAHFLELKRQGETLSDVQQEFQFFCLANGYPYAVADTLPDVIATLKDWGAIRASVSA
jgi:hypothetical protein